VISNRSSQQARSVVLDTSMGPITLELYWQHAPKTCHNFEQLARKGYYNNTVFHRVIPGFMVQGGDPTGTGRGGASIYGAKFEDEINSELKHTGAGILSMANSGPNTNGSQFFITEQAYPSLSQHYTLFGQCDDASVEVVKAIARVDRDANDKPLSPVLLNKVTIVREGQPLPPAPATPAPPPAAAPPKP